MAYIIKYLYNLLDEVYRDRLDPRVVHLPLVGSPLPIFLVISVYLIIVLHLGPKWMKHRKPYNLKYIMRFYNAIQVVSNLIIFTLGISNSYLRKEFSLTCQAIDSTNTTPWMKTLLLATYGYYITKFLDLFDTVPGATVCFAYTAYSETSLNIDLRPHRFK